MNYHYAKRMSGLKASEIRELLKITQHPDVISFAGGLPAPELFPIREISAMSALVLERSGPQTLQYATTEGYQPLRNWIARRMNATLGTNFDENSILITNGSQQALDLTGKVFLDEGDVVLCESPTYLAAISAFKAYGCRFVEVPTDNSGMIMDALETALKREQRAKAIYVIPNFQNPTGRTMSLERRKRIAELASQQGVMIIEDNPYGELRFEGEYLPSIQSFDTNGCVVCAGTFSKILCPGLRIGWIAGNKDVIRNYVLVKQGVDLHSNTFAQSLIAAYLEHCDIDEHVKKLCAAYKKRRDVAIETMERLFSHHIHFTRPQGGLFAWITAPPQVNMREVLEACLERKVAFVPGGSFFPNGGNENTMRINYSNMEEERIIRGLGIIAAAMHKAMEKKEHTHSQSRLVYC